MSKLKRKSEALAAPRDAAEANAHLHRLGEIARALGLIKAAQSENVASLAKMVEEDSAPYLGEQQRLVAGLQLWAEANRAALTDGGRTKTIRLAAGAVSWRARPMSVTLRGVEAILDWLVAREAQKFIRTKTEVNKEAMLADPEAARLVPGVTIASGGEDFVVEPVALAGGVS